MKPQQPDNQQATQIQTTTTAYDYAQCVLVVPKIRLLPLFSQGIVAIKGNELVFQDIKGRSFTEALANITISETSSKELLIKLPTGQLWHFAGFYPAVPVSKKLRELTASFPVYSSEQTSGSSQNKSSGDIASAAAQLGMASGLGALGVIPGIGGAKVLDQMVVDTTKQIDELVGELKKRGATANVSNKNSLLSLAQFNAGASNKKRFGFGLLVVIIVMIIVGLVNFIFR